MASGENVLWIVLHAQISTAYGADWPKKPSHKEYVFRTRAAADAYIKSRKPRAHFAWTGPRRATWGPEQ